MPKKIFVSNLDFEVTTEQVLALFSEVGPVTSAVVATDRETKRSKGFAFVEMERDEDAQKAIDTIHGKVINGRPIKVVEDRGKSPAANGVFGDGGESRPREFLPSIQRTQIFRRRKRLDPFMQDPNRTVDYKDVAMLSRFVSERGKILARRFTGLSAYNQRKVAKAIKRAQNLGLMSFTTIVK